jgi:cell division septal protein FtsQ
MESSNTLKQIGFIFLFLIAGALTYFGVTSSSNRIVSVMKVVGLKNIEKNEFLEIVSRLHWDKKFFYKINAQDLINQLEKQPLIKSATVRPVLFPKKQIKILVQEEVPWFFYRNQIINKEGDVIIKSQAEAKLFNSPSIEKLYADFQNQQSRLIELKSYNELNKKDFNKLKAISDHVNLDLKLISPDERVTSIRIDSDNNLFIQSQNYEFKAGIFDKKVMERIQKLDLVAKKIREIEKSGTKLAYVDLSLGADEVIVGKETLEAL